MKKEATVPHFCIYSQQKVDILATDKCKWMNGWDG
jgi:hypothetical protein